MEEVLGRAPGRGPGARGVVCVRTQSPPAREGGSHGGSTRALFCMVPLGTTRELVEEDEDHEDLSPSDVKQE